MKVFRYSKNEYQRNTRKYLPSSDYAWKHVNLTRTGIDDKTCQMSLLGYPLMPGTIDQDKDEMFEALAGQIEAEKPQILAI